MTAVMLLIVNLLRGAGVPVHSFEDPASYAVTSKGPGPGTPPSPPAVGDPIAISNGF